jgi:hypothetical protein
MHWGRKKRPWHLIVRDNKVISLPAYPSFWQEKSPTSPHIRQETSIGSEKGYESIFYEGCVSKPDG